jgi:hypothetical protein
VLAFVMLAALVVVAVLMRMPAILRPLVRFLSVNVRRRTTIRYGLSLPDSKKAKDNSVPPEGL